MEIVEVPWSDPDLVGRSVEVINATRPVDGPWLHPLTVAGRAGHLRWGWDGEAPLASILVADGVDLAVGSYEVSSYDNLHLAWLGVIVHPEHRRSGHGSRLLTALMDRARADGRTSAGISGWDHPATVAFAERHGFQQRSVAVLRRQRPHELDWASLDRLWDESRPRAAAYDLERRLGPTPEDELEETAVMAAAINDAPTDDLDVEDEVYTAERVRGYEEAQAGQGNLLHTIVARHRESGALAGVTTVAVETERPHLAEQHDTSVMRAHRGHRLGLLLKLDMMRWLRETQPQIESIDTWNAESNDHMIGVNELLGYRATARELSFQRPL